VTVPGPVPLFHLVFTNAPGPGGGGFRHLAPGAAPPDAARVRAWLEALRPERAGVPGWVAGAFRLDGVLHVAVARAAGSPAGDEHGRPGTLLAHAVVAPAGEGGPDRALLPALVAGLAEVAGPPREGGELAGLLGRCGGARELAPPPAAAAALAGVDPRLLAALLAASHDPDRRVEVPLGDDPPAAGARRVAAAAGALPPRLRLALQWSVAARPLPATALALLAGAGPAPPPARGPAADYQGWLGARLAAGDQGAVAAVTGDWEVRSWRQLAARAAEPVARGSR
jgi:hypothetical protein